MGVTIPKWPNVSFGGWLGKGICVAKHFRLVNYQKQMIRALETTSTTKDRVIHDIQKPRTAVAHALLNMGCPWVPQKSYLIGKTIGVGAPLWQTKPNGWEYLKVGDSIPFVVGPAHFSGHHWSYIWIWARHGAVIQIFSCEKESAWKQMRKPTRDLKFRPAQKICPWQPPYPLCHSLTFFKTRRCNGGGLPFGSNGKSTIYRQLFLIFHVQESSKDFPLQCLIARGCNLAWPNSKWPVSGQAPEAAPEARK